MRKSSMKKIKLKPILTYRVYLYRGPLENPIDSKRLQVYYGEYPDKAVNAWKISRRFIQYFCPPNCHLVCERITTQETETQTQIIKMRGFIYGK